MSTTHPSHRRAEPAWQAAESLHAAAIHLLRCLRHADAASTLNAPRLSALSVIVFSGPLTLGHLADAEQVRPPTMTRIVHALEAQGLVVKTGDPADRRTIRLSATMKGKRLLLHARRRRLQTLATHIAALALGEQATLRRAQPILAKLAVRRDSGLKPGRG
ncbi:MAG: MarR family transcriptional regulator, partial [Acidobacteriaceae bacterium]